MHQKFGVKEVAFKRYRKKYFIPLYSISQNTLSSLPTHFWPRCFFFFFFQNTVRSCPKRHYNEKKKTASNALLQRTNKANKIHDSHCTNNANKIGEISPKMLWLLSWAPKNFEKSTHVVDIDFLFGLLMTKR